jgi:peptide-methionine (S)-S-oxide reductase
VATEKATFGAGCFWGVEAAFRQVPGVTATAVGYMGGDLKNPTYRDVCTDQTGHAEVVEVTFDPAQVSYADLLKVFGRITTPRNSTARGPTTANNIALRYFSLAGAGGRGPRVEGSARSSPGQYKRRIVTEITPAAEFWRAEEYHQQYLEKRGMASCHIK